ncbi:uncharacterized protein LOC129720268 [Wyeomyia smithii]|uniref:uncharacterized protein LOC129720268 n=1 Tax=Wyeomyia smithii TaxID=174621 RepID=UPI002467E5B2|nr:uncharacterized protein LOC129720268 [Wyeomyia smithii]
MGEKSLHNTFMKVFRGFTSFDLKTFRFYNFSHRSISLTKRTKPKTNAMLPNMLVTRCLTDRSSLFSVPAAAAENVKTKHRPQLVLPKFFAVRMKIMTEVCEKRKRQLLNTVLEEVKDNPESLEKPTAQIFYMKIAEKTLSIEALNWTLMKSRLRNLKTSYLKADAWKNQTGAGLLAEGMESSVSEYIHKICPYYETLEQIFGQRKSVKPDVVIETSSSTYEDCIVETEPVNASISELYDSDQFVTQDAAFIENITEEEVLSQDCEYGTDANRTISGMDFTAFKNQLKKRPLKRNKPSINSGSISLLVDIQEKKLKFEETKWNKQIHMEEERLQLAKVQAENEVELKKLELSHQLEIRKLELEKEERLATAKMNLDMEYMERIKKYELHLKANNNV